MILGIDIGGTSVKFGLVSDKGEITYRRSFLTESWVEDQGFINGLIKEIRNYIQSFPGIQGVGIGFPGILTKDRTGIILLQNILSLQNFDLWPLLTKEFPGIKFRIENDANCAALGEHYFGENKGLDNFLLITLGTGIGSGAVIDGKLFIGARGNGLELGDMLTDGKRTLESQIGLNRIVEYAIHLLKNSPNQESILEINTITPKSIYEAALQGDVIARSVYNYMGTLLGECLVSAIRLLDVTNLLLGGGIAGAFQFIEPATRKVLKKHLHEYYINELQIKRASLSNDAGILGAASLIM